jgi:putative protease
MQEMRDGIEYAHSKGVKVYVTVNILAHNEDLEEADDYLMQLAGMMPDALLVADPGMFMRARRFCPDIPIHISTQANNVNYETFLFWHNLGAERVVCGRELSLKEIREIRDHVPDELEIEAFIHGAMCISYSGRCLLSNFMAGRDANRGACTHPCRWKYALVEEQRPGQYYPIEEDAYGSYILNSRDLCMIDHIPELAEAGVYSLKIEGRMKSMYYVATVVTAYRAAIDDYLSDPENYRFDPKYYDELCKASHREFTHGFYFNKPTDKDQNYITSDYIRDYSFIGLVREIDSETGLTTVEQRNKFSVGDTVEIFGPHTPYYEETIHEMYDEEGNAIESAPHPQQILRIRFERTPEQGFIMRKKK